MLKCSDKPSHSASTGPVHCSRRNERAKEAVLLAGRDGEAWVESETKNLEKVELELS
jgi:hypothetical protein